MTAKTYRSRSGGFAGLRVKATDKAGNAVDETILRAYEIR